jgi:hypothetical protein
MNKPKQQLNKQIQPIQLNIDNLKDVKTLIFDNGAMWGLSLVGALKYLVNNKMDLTNISNYIGTSAGAVFCLLLAIGYNLNEIYDILLHKITLNEICTSNPLYQIYNLCYGWGLYSADEVDIFFEKLIRKKTKKHNMTFAEFTYRFPNKNLYLIGTNISDQQPIIFSNITTPNITLSKAIIICITLPGIVTISSINNKYYADGALILSHIYELVIKPEKFLLNDSYRDNFMTEKNRIRLIKKFKKINPRTILNLQFDRKNSKYPINNIFDYISIFSSCMAVYSYRINSYPNTILLDLSEINPIDFNINNKKKIEIIKKGYFLTKKHFC